MMLRYVDHVDDVDDIDHLLVLAILTHMRFCFWMSNQQNIDGLCLAGSDVVTVVYEEHD